MELQPNLSSSLSLGPDCEWRGPGEDSGWIQATSVEDCHPGGEDTNSAWGGRELPPLLLHSRTRWEDLGF